VAGARRDGVRSALQTPLATDPRDAIDQIHELGLQAEGAIEDVRSLARGIYPSLLTDRGLSEAVHTVARQAPLPVRIDAVGVTRQPIEIETAVYFTCAEALQNATKHATGATGVWIRLRQTPTTLSFEVRDDGPGLTPGTREGRGLRNMHDRIEGVRGRLAIDATPGKGTRVAGSVEVG
jgi:signal transduction histidine kinase